MADTGAEAAHRYREHMRAKARRLGEGEDATSVDASDFTPAEKLYAGVKTGMRPVSRQARKDGGQVTGKCAGGRADRPARKTGGGLGESYVNRDSKAADEAREGHYPNGGMKKGGRAHKAGGGFNPADLFAMGALPMAIKAMSGGDGDDDKPAYAPGAPGAGGGKQAGGRVGRAEGGYLPNKDGPSETRALKRKTGSSAVETGERPAAEDGRQGRASGGRAHRQGGGPLATPLSAGMGGQGRFNFNYGPQTSEASKLGLRDGGRAKARERYGPGPGSQEHHPGLARAKRANGGGDDDYNTWEAEDRADERYDRERDEADYHGKPAAEAQFHATLARRPPAPSFTAVQRAEKKAQRAGRAAGGPAPEESTPISAPPLSRLKGRYARPLSRGRANGGAAPGPAENAGAVGPDTTTSAAPGPAESGYAGPRYNKLAVQSAIDSSNRRGRRIGGKEARMIHALLKGHQRGDYASGGEVAKKALAAHHAEHEAMAKGRASGGGISDDPPSYERAQARQGRAAALAQKAAFRAAGKSKAAGGKAGHGPDCDCPRCASRKAKGGLLSAFGRMSKAEGGRTAHARGGKSGKGTKINIIIAPGGMNPPDPNAAAGGMPPNLAIKPPPAMPMPMPGGAPGAPPGAPAMPMPIPVPMGGGMPGAGGAPPPRARGGRAPRVRGEPEAGSGSGLGRLQKAEAYGHRSREGEGLRK